jgi:hypothetical protein
MIQDMGEIEASQEKEYDVVVALHESGKARFLIN